MGTTNGLKALGVGIILFALGFGSGFPLLFRLGYALLALAALGIAWTGANLIGIELVRQTRDTRAEVGQTVEERFVLRNRLLIPKLWLECRDYATLPNHHASRAFDLGPRQRRTWTVRTICHNRGRFAFGPITITTGDPFGLFRMRRRWRERRELIVYPATVEFHRLSVPMGPLSGGGMVRGRSHDVTPNSLSVREYQPGDSLHRIHWPSTARLGSLMVKEFEPDPFSDIWIALDADAKVQHGRGTESTEEYGVKIAASMAKHFLARHRAVGLIVDGGYRLILPADRGHGHLVKILESLAVLRAAGRRPIDELLLAEAGRFGRNSTLFVITPSEATAWPRVLQGASRAVRAVAVLIDGGSFDVVDERGVGDQFGVVAARDGGTVPESGRRGSAPADLNVPAFAVGRGDDIALALSGAVGRW